ncbi:MAG: RNA repair transcriptional activator RtcR family protein [Pyrinomonadaceae bacterium]
MKTKKDRIVFGALGTKKDDKGTAEKRWKEYRPTVAICTDPNFPVSRYEMFYQPDFGVLAQQVKADVELKSDTDVRLTCVDFNDDPWNLEYVYVAFYDFFRKYKFDRNKADYFLNISTGTHVMQICLFLLAEAGHVPAKLVQKSPWKPDIIVTDLELERFDLIAKRFHNEESDDVAHLKDHIDTKNADYEKQIRRILAVSEKYDYPILLTGKTGVGKTSLAKRIHELRKKKQKNSGTLISVNCAALAGDVVRSELFGHVQGAFTGATKEKKGLLDAANKGTLFLDEIGELNLEVQKMLLTAIEDKEFLPVGSTEKAKSDFYFIAGTNSDLREKVRSGEFRNDLLARIDAFHFPLPDLKSRPEDFEPNLDREIERFMAKNKIKLSINDTARKRYLDFAKSPDATWDNNFRDLSSSVIRMGTYAPSGRITLREVEEEIQCLKDRWKRTLFEMERYPLSLRFLGSEGIKNYDLIRIAELEVVLESCLKSHTAAEAGRKLYSFSGTGNPLLNFTDKISKKLRSFNLDWKAVKGSSH